MNKSPTPDPWWDWDTEDDDNWLSEFGGEDMRKLVRERNRLLANGDVIAIIEDHHLEIGVDQSDSTWLECWCGWDETKKGATGWHQHLIDAVKAGGRDDSA